jgi:UPF0716 protein FxsA
LRGGLPTAIFLVLLVTVPTFEIWLLFQVADQIGGWPTLGILVVEALLGAWLMRREGRRAWAALTEAFGTGRIPSGELADAALVLVGGVLLMLPGFATDIIGFLFLLPLTRPAARKLVAFFIARRISRLGVPTAARGRGDVIEGETVEDPGRHPGPANGSTVIRGEILDR